jgi:hypothetical protein
MKARLIATALVFVLCSAAVAATPLDGVWTPADYPFRSEAVVKFSDGALQAHLGGYRYSGGYSADGGRLEFTEMIVIDGRIHPDEARDANAWSYWRET